MTETVEKSADTGEKKGRGRSGPLPFRETPTPRDRVVGESLAKKTLETTGRTISMMDCLAVKWALTRWYDDPETKALLKNMDSQMKRAKAQEKAEAARKLLLEAEAELGDIESDLDSDDASEDEDIEAAAAGDDDSDEDSDEDLDEDDLFDEEKVSTTF